MRATLDIREEARTGAGARGVSLFPVEAVWNEVAFGGPTLHRERLAAIGGY
jgi:hypothetical protein